MTIDFELLNNTPFTLVVWHNEDGEEKAKVYKRVAKWLPPLKSVSVHEYGSDTPIMVLTEEALPRIQQAPNERIKEILLGADYFINLSIDDLPEGGLGVE